jgi:hypothetical protein
VSVEEKIPAQVSEQQGGGENYVMKSSFYGYCSAAKQNMGTPLKTR